MRRLFLLFLRMPDARAHPLPKQSATLTQSPMSQLRSQKPC
jgi:hypothetical protein